MTSLATLSARELEVFQLIVAGKRMKEIAGALAIDVKTVSTYRVRLCQKLAVRTDAQLTLIHVRRELDRAADHALVAAALCAGVARWEPFSGDPTGASGDVCIGHGIRYTTSLDDAGVPILTNMLREALTVALPFTAKAAA